MLEHLILNGRLEAAYHYHDTAPRNFQEELLSHFSKGKRKEFLKLFLLLRTEEKLEFYVRVYFLIYNIHPALKGKPTIPQDEINAFRQYLNTKGADLAKTNQFLQFYALPYVKKPLQHPSYKVLFKREWVNNLTEKLQIYLQNEQRRMKDIVSKEESDSKRMRSPQFVQPPEVSSIHLKNLEEKNRKLFEEVEVFKRKYSQLQKNNQALIDSFNSHLMESQNKWFQVTRELTSNSRTLVDLIFRSNSNLIQDRRFQRIKKRTEKYQKMVKKELDELLNQSQDLSVFDKPSNNEVSYSASATPNVSQRNITTFVTIDQMVPTNYVTLIKDFRSMPDAQKVLVIQGFSWRIVKSKNKWIRRQNIIGLMVNDVLGIVNGDIQILLFNKVLMNHVVRLFLFISEDSYGKKVLFRNGGLYKQIIDLIPQTLQDQNFSCLDMLLEILINILHSKEILIELINLNIIGLSINTLLQIQEVVINDQILQSISTILLNATATEEGLNAFQYEVNVFFYLCQVFKQANDCNRNLIGALIFALLGRKNLWKLAHQAKLPDFIDDMIRIDERSNKQQLKLIKQRLHTFEPGKTMNQTQFDDIQSQDSNLQEQNFERNEDELTDLEEYIKGHDLLSNKYSLKQRQAQKQLEQINKIMNESRAVITPALDEITILREQVKKQEKKKVENVRLPEIKKKKEELGLYNPKAKDKNIENKEYYSYKSPGFKSREPKNANSLQVEPLQHQKQTSHQKYRVTSFDYQKQQRRVGRVQTTKNQEKIKENQKKEGPKSRNEKKSADKPEYRIKKSTSVEKGLGNPYRRQLAYQSNKNPSNVADYKVPDGFKSPPQKKSKEEVLKQLNQELRAEKKAEDQKISSRNNLPPPNNPVMGQRQNTHLKKNNFVGAPTTEELRAFESKPKLRRTPPREDEK